MENEKAHYVLGYYAHLMTMQERLAQRHLIATQKATHGRSDSAAQNELRNSTHHLGRLLSSDPEVLKLVADGIEAFVVRTSQRILDAHSNEIVFNYCPSAVLWRKRRKPGSVVFASTTGTLAIEFRVTHYFTGEELQVKFSGDFC